MESCNFENNSQTGIRPGQSKAHDARQAAREFHAAVAQPKMAFVLFFCSCHYDQAALEHELHRLFGTTPLIGCTTAGEVGPCGMSHNSLAGASFSSSHFSVEIGCLDDLKDFETRQGHELAKDLLLKLGRRFDTLSAQNCFALLLIDGLSMREESVTRALHEVLGGVGLAGGSAGGGIRMQNVRVYAQGSFRSGRAVCTLVATHLPFFVTKTQHFLPHEQRLVITEADPARRLVSEINGRPAADEYARLIGVPRAELSPRVYASSPFVVLINGNLHVRAVQQVMPDGSLYFACAIERGIVLRLAHGVDLTENLDACFDEIRAAIGQPQLTIAFDCMMRRLEIEQKRLEQPVGAILQRNRTVGFSTYGEQFGGLHINQTFTCVSIGYPPVEEQHE